LFGWKIYRSPESNTPKGMENWTVITTDHNGNEGLGGGMSKRQMPQQQITNFIDVKSVDEYSSKVEKIGGKVVAAKHAVPGMGYFVLCRDTENNSFAIWESNENAK
jgi:predicted enzyme related to lactoylglutathione lyase